MAATATKLTEGSTTSGGTSYVTASIAPTASRLYLAYFACSVATAPTPDVTLSGAGLTWTKIGQNDGTAIRSGYLYRAVGTPTAGALTFTAASDLTSALWVVAEVDGVKLSGTNGSDAIVQVLNSRSAASSTSVDSPFGVTVGAGNAAFAGLFAEGTQELIGAGTGWTSVGATYIGAPSTSILAEFDGTTPPQNVTSATFTGVGTAHWGVMAVELAAGSLAPESSFTSDKTTGGAPLEVAFTDTSTGSPTSWAWDFGDGNTSTAQHPTHTFAEAGDYTVSLTATNSHGSDATPATAVISVTAPVSYTVLKLRGGVYTATTIYRLAGGVYA